MATTLKKMVGGRIFQLIVFFKRLLIGCDKLKVTGKKMRKKLKLGNCNLKFLGLVCHIVLRLKNIHFSWFWGLKEYYTRHSHVDSDMDGQ